MIISSLNQVMGARDHSKNRAISRKMMNGVICILLAIVSIVMFSCDDEAKTLVSIEVTTQPTKTTYTVGETFNPAGMVVTATFSDGSTEMVALTSVTITSDFSTPGAKTVTISFTYEGTTVTTSVTGITVNPLEVAPVLTTAAVSEITATTATTGGNITNVGTPAYTERGVCYGTTANPTVANTKIAVDGSGTGSFAANLAGLTAETQYYVRAYATNSIGTTYGNEISFTTAAVVSVPDGSEGNPFIVATVADLQKVGSGTGGWGLDKHYSQTADIDLNGVTWTPIGIGTTMANSFTGSYNGGGYSISNLNVNGASGDYGLFGAIRTGGAVRNVALINVSVSSTQGGSIGGIAGLNEGMIENCYVTGSIDAFQDGGGVAGTSYDGTVINCYTTCDVTGSSTGGIVGDNSFRSTIANCYATGKISGGYVGGITAYNRGTVERCVALNWHVSAIEDYAGRILYGAMEGTTITGNYARDEGMTLTASGVDVTPTSDATGIHGANVSAADTHGANSGSWWSGTVDFSDTFWSFANNRLPHLKTTADSAFDEEQDPEVQ